MRFQMQACRHNLCSDCVHQCREMRRFGVVIHHKCPVEGCEKLVSEEEIQMMQNFRHSPDIDTYKDSLQLVKEESHCDQCYQSIGPYYGVFIRSCFHKICLKCVQVSTAHRQFSCAKCPVEGCKATISYREIELLDTDKSTFDDTIPYLRDKKLLWQDLWPCKTAGPCRACGKFLMNFEGVLLKMCQRHRVCKKCLYHTVLVFDVNQGGTPYCPAPNCQAVLQRLEVLALRNEIEVWQRRGNQYVWERKEVGEAVELRQMGEIPVEVMTCNMQCHSCERPVQAFKGIVVKRCRHSLCKFCFRCCVGRRECIVPRCNSPIHMGVIEVVAANL